MNSEKELILKALLNATKAILNTDMDNLNGYRMDHDTPNFNIEINITLR